jgi:hypothetical protein
MQTTTFLELHRSRILSDAAAGAANAPRYAAAGTAETAERLDRLFDELVTAVDGRDLASVVAYARDLGRARHAGGYDLSEVQVAINALEESVWRRVFADAPAELVGSALREVSTVLGAAKDALAREYVVLASSTRAPALDVGALFTGASS